MCLYSAEGQHTIIGLYWFVSETVISKSEMMFDRFALVPLLVRSSLDVALYVKGGLVLMEQFGSMPVQNTTLAIGFDMAMVDIF